MSQAWMPFYGADFIGNTLHLSRGEIGSYVLLLWHHWEHGSLPADERELRRIARVAPPHWRDVWAALKPLFQTDEGNPTRVTQQRLLVELSKAAKISSKRKGAAEQMHKLKHANAEQLHTHSQSPSQSKKDKKSYNAGVSCETGVKTPAHGVRSADGRFVYFKRGTDEFVAYVNDYLEGTGDEPNATADGRWFKVYGEEAQPIAEKAKSNGISSELEATVKARGWA